MKKNLVINCATCDARNIKEENYSNYESITVNAAAVLTNSGAKAVLNRLPAELNCADVIETEDDVELRSSNGKLEIKSGDAAPAGQYLLMVNGSLVIGPDTQKYFENCMGIRVNGSCLCAESVYPFLTALKVNGSVKCYPDSAVILKRNAVIDRLFALRAKNSLYWAQKRMIMVDPELNAAVLKEKGASFSAGEIIIAESKVETLMDILDEKAEIIIVPDGTEVITDDTELNKSTLRKYGSRLYIIGDVTVPEKDDILDKIEYLNVKGDVTVPESREEKLDEVLKGISGEVKVIKPGSTVINDRPLVKITGWMLEKNPGGLHVTDCAVVSIADDISKELITERLIIDDCAVVKCSEEQEDAVAFICNDVGQIQNGNNDENAAGMGSVLKTIMPSADTKVINAADYVM